MRKGLTAGAVAVLAMACLATMVDAGTQADVTKLRNMLEKGEESAIENVRKAPLSVQKALVPDLIDTYLDGGWNQSAAAKPLLVDIGRKAPKAVVPHVADRFLEADSDEVATRLPLIELLRDLGPHAKLAVPAVTEALQSDDLSIQQQAVWTAAAIGKPAEQAAPALLDLLDAGDALLREDVVEALNIIGPGSSAVPRLAEALENNDPRVQRFAIESLAALGPKASEAVPALTEAAANADRFLQLKAANALGAIGPAAEQALPVLREIAEGKSPKARETIQAALDSIRITNEPPAAGKVAVRCKEGATVEIECPIRDEDDLDVALRTEVVNAPQNGRFERTGRRAFVYHCPRGVTARQTFTWRATDGQDESSLAKGTITIEPDTRAPVVSNVFCAGNKHIVVTFDEPVSAPTAGKTANYNVAPGLKVKKAELAEDAKTVLLSVPELSRGKEYTLTVTGVADRAKARNRTKKRRFTLQYELYETFEYYADDTRPDKFPQWETGADSTRCRVDGKKFAGQDVGKVLHMEADDGDDWQEVLLHEFGKPLTGLWQFELKYWETGDNRDGNLWLWDTAGDPVIGAGTENPQWEVAIGNKEVVNDENAGDDYEHWIHVMMQVDTEKDRARVTFKDTDDGTEKTYGWFDLPEVDGIAGLGIGPDRVWYVDDIRAFRPSQEN